MLRRKKRKILFTETVLRDGHQSIMATRMATKEMEPIIRTMDEVGYYAVECWGGATYDVCLRYLNEDPWDRLRTLRKGFQKTKLQMLLRGQNLLGYRHYSDDVVESFVQRAVYHGIDIIRIFDALNDIRNIEKAAQVAKREGAHVQLAMAYTTGSAYDIRYWVDLAKKLDQMGADSICIKDMAGLLLPYDAELLIKEIKKVTKLPLHLHSHCTSGIAPITYIKAAEAGCDGLDTVISPFAMGCSQPPTESIYETIKHKYDSVTFNTQRLKEVSDYFHIIREKAECDGKVKRSVMDVDVDALQYQIPGGMLSNLYQQIEEQKLQASFAQVLEEIPRVRKDLGEPPLVTPSSQIIGTQAIFNVIAGKRYGIVSNQTKAFIRGEYGKTIKPFSPQIQRQILGSHEELNCRPADLLEPELHLVKQSYCKENDSIEKILSYALFPQSAETYYSKERL